MTITAQGVRAVYPGAGSTGPFTLQDADAQAILFSNNAEIVATRYDALGVPDILTLTLEYSLTGAGSPTAGSLTLVSALTVGHTLVIQRITPRTQLIDLISGGKLAMTTLENMLDKLIRIDQEDQEASLRAISFPSTYTGDQVFFPLPNDPGDNDAYIAYVDGVLTTTTGTSGSDGGITQGEADLRYQPLDADLTSIAALATSAAGRSILALADPNADRIAFWDDSVGAMDWLTLGTNLSITGTTINAASGAGIGGATGSTDNAIIRADGTGGATVQGSAPTIDDSGNLSVGTSAAITAGTIELGAATDTTISRASAGTIAVEGQNVLTAATGQPLDADLTAIAALTTTSFGRSVLTQAAASNLATLAGVGTGDSPQFTAVNIGAATDTTLARVSAGVISVEGVTLLTTATGQPLDADLTAIAALTTTSFGRSVLDRADAAALATLAGVGTANNPQFATIELGAASDTTLSRSSAGVLAVEGVVVPTVSSTNTLTNKTIAFGSNTISGITGSILFNIDGGGSAITTGVKGYLPIPFACTITGWTLLGDVSGSCVVDIWKDTYANYPPVVGDTITAAAKPTISSAVKGQSSTLTGWTTSVASGDVLAFNIDSNATITKLSIELKITRS